MHDHVAGWGLPCLQLCQPTGLNAALAWDLAFSLAWRLGVFRSWIEGLCRGTTTGAFSVYGPHLLDGFHSWDTEYLRHPGPGRRAESQVGHVKRQAQLALLAAVAFGARGHAGPEHCPNRVRPAGASAFITLGLFAMCCLQGRN